MLLAKPRAVGGLLALALMAANLAIAGFGAGAIGIALAWMLALIVGGRWRLIRSIVGSWPDVRLDRGQSWWGALAGGSAALMLAASWFRQDALTIAAASIGPWLLCYAAGKLGCHAAGCCHAAGLSWSLPLGEALVSAGMALLTSAMYWQEFIELAIVCGAGFHLAERLIADRLRFRGRLRLACGLPSSQASSLMRPAGGQRTPL